MRKILIPAVASLVSLGASVAAPVAAQMHKVAAPEEVVRAVGVYEWTGDRAKPTASRLIPVSIFINGKLEDAGVYLARPVPLALDSGTVYEVDRAGAPDGTVDLRYASHLNASGAGATAQGGTGQATEFDDGWFGYGVYAPAPPPRKTVALKESKRPGQVLSSKPDTAKPDTARPDPDRPSFSKRPEPGETTDKTQTTKTAGAETGGAETSAPAKPANSGTTSADSGTSSETSKTGASKTDDDPDRPHLIRKPEAPAPPDGGPAQTGTTAGKSTGTVPAEDPDRPTLKKRSPDEAKKARRESQESSASGLATSLNDDPNRPTLHHGKGQQAMTEAEFPKLKGVPQNLHQAVAVSDAKTRPAHDFLRPWEDDAEKAAVLAKMQAMARAQISAYRGKLSGAATAPTPAVKRTPNSKLRRPKTNDVAGPPEPLFEEDLRGFTLSYGGAATYVYTARTDGEGATLFYVTVVAQMDALGTLQPVVQNVTDAAHLDRTPWMRLVDVVDAEASNRASLLFELREKDSRQFALYRVIAARSEQTFLTGTTQ